MGMPAREATIKAMDEITGPVIGITLVLAAVLGHAHVVAVGLFGDGQLVQGVAAEVGVPGDVEAQVVGRFAGDGDGVGGGDLDVRSVGRADGDLVACSGLHTGRHRTGP